MKLFSFGVAIQSIDANGSNDIVLTRNLMLLTHGRNLQEDGSSDTGKTSKARNTSLVGGVS